MNDDVVMDGNAVSLSINVSGESDVGSWSLEGGELRSHFYWIDDESSRMIWIILWRWIWPQRSLR